MNISNKKKFKKVDLLKMSDSEKSKLIKAVRRSLQRKVAETRLCQSFLDAENMKINGQNLNYKGIKLTGLSLKAELLKGM